MQLLWIHYLAMVAVLPVAAMDPTQVQFTITASPTQFPGGAGPNFFGNITGVGTHSLKLTPNVPGALSVTQFSHFYPFDFFPHNYPPNTSGVYPTTIASATFFQTITVDVFPYLVSRTVLRTASLIYDNLGVGTCQALLSLSPVSLTFDLGPVGKVDVNLNSPPTLAVPCTPSVNGTLMNSFVDTPGLVPIPVLLHDVPGQGPISPTPLPPSVILTMIGLAGVGVYETKRRWLARIRAGH